MLNSMPGHTNTEILALFSDIFICSSYRIRFKSLISTDKGLKKISKDFYHFKNRLNLDNWQELAPVDRDACSGSVTQAKSFLERNQLLAAPALVVGHGRIEKKAGLDALASAQVGDFIFYHEAAKSLFFMEPQVYFGCRAGTTD